MGRAEITCPKGQNARVILKTALARNGGRREAVNGVELATCELEHEEKGGNGVELATCELEHKRRTRRKSGKTADCVEHAQCELEHRGLPKLKNSTEFELAVENPHVVIPDDVVSGDIPVLRSNPMLSFPTTWYPGTFLSLGVAFTNR